MSEEARPELYARHLLVCQQVLYDPFQPGAAFSLRSLVVFLQPNDDIGYPFAIEELAVFAQVYGDAGEYQLWLDLIALGDDGEPDVLVLTHGPVVVYVRPARFVDGVHIRLRNVPFPRAGVYEFRLRRESEGPLAAERLLLKE